MKKLLATAACLGLMMGISGMAEANLITNGSFEGGPQGTSYVTINSNGDIGNTSIPGWTVYGSVDWINNYWQNSNGSNSLDLAGYYLQGMVLSNPFPTTPNATYRVTFDMAGNPDQPYNKTLLAVYMNNPDSTLGLYPFTFIQAGHTAGNMGWQTESFDFVAADTTAQLAFLDITVSPYGTGNAWGAALDNVNVNPVPEPSTFCLLGAGLASIGLFGRRFRKTTLQV